MTKRYVVHFVIASVIAASGPVLAAGPLDGTYRGDTSLVGSRGRRCTPGGAMRVRVVDSAFDWKRDGQLVSVKIGPDGTFSSQNGRRFVSGTITGNTLSAVAKGAACDYSWTLAK